MAGELEFADRERTEFGWAWTKPHPLGWVPFAVCLFGEGRIEVTEPGSDFGI